MKSIFIIILFTILFVECFSQEKEVDFEVLIFWKNNINFFHNNSKTQNFKFPTNYTNGISLNPILKFNKLKYRLGFSPNFSYEKRKYSVQYKYTTLNKSEIKLKGVEIADSYNFGIEIYYFLPLRKSKFSFSIIMVYP